MEGNINNNETKEIIYKGKKKIIPKCNADSNLCENFIIAKMRYCKFDKHPGSQFCIYHIPKDDNTTDVTFIDCPIDPSHRVIAEKLKRHIKVCTKLGEKQKLKANIWFSEAINTVKENNEIIKEKLLEDKSGVNLKELRWEDLSDEEYANTLDKIVKCYEVLREDYKLYAEKNNLEQILKEKTEKANLNNLNDGEEEGNDFKMFLSGIDINHSTDFDFTKNLAKSEKNGKQNIAITDVMKIFNIINENNVYVEFGAGKGGLSFHINSLTNDKSKHILLERDGVRFKKDRHCENLTRFRTDIKDFNLNYIDDYFSENKEKELSSDYNIIGVAKHICGCAFDLSLTCLLNYKKQDRIKGICMATCCHHICIAEFLNNLSHYTEYLGLSIKEIMLLFKSTSWIFGPIDINTSESSERINSNKIFKEKGIRKNYIGLISKYIVDLARVNFLISKNFKVFYLKYCKNEVTTENNLILAIKD